MATAVHTCNIKVGGKCWKPTSWLWIRRACPN